MATAVKKTAKGAAGSPKKTVRQRAAEIREEMKEAYDLGYRHGYTGTGSRRTGRSERSRKKQE